jgi:hypothetical protein
VPSISLFPHLPPFLDLPETWLTTVKKKTVGEGGVKSEKVNVTLACGVYLGGVKIKGGVIFSIIRLWEDLGSPTYLFIYLFIMNQQSES